MELKIYRKPHDVPFEVDEYLAREALLNNVTYGVLERSRRTYDGKGEFYFFVVRDAEGHIVQYAHLTPPHPLCLSLGTHEGIGSFKRGLLDAKIPFSNVVGKKEMVDHFLDSTPQLQRMGIERQGFYKLTKLIPAPATGARFVPATMGDLDLLTDWSLAFDAEVNEPRVSREARLPHMEQKIKACESYFLKVGDKAVATASAGRSLPKGRSVGFVYTPPEQRKKGYAAEVTAKLSELLLQNGNDYCCLFTQLENPTSNRIYQAIGYQWICEFQNVTVK